MHRWCKRRQARNLRSLIAARLECCLVQDAACLHSLERTQSQACQLTFPKLSFAQATSQQNERPAVSPPVATPERIPLNTGRRRLVILGSGWAAARLAHDINAKQYDMTVSNASHNHKATL